MSRIHKVNGRTVVSHNEEAFPNTVWVEVAAISSITDRDSGIVSLEFPARELTDGEYAMIYRLFPNLHERVFEILNQETLLEAIKVAQRS